MKFDKFTSALVQNSKKPSNLLAMAVGIKQKDNVNKIVKKVKKALFLYSVLFWCPAYAKFLFWPSLQFLSSDFAVMFFHYDEVVDEWKDFEWNRHVIHIAAASQTKW